MGTEDFLAVELLTAADDDMFTLPRDGAAVLLLLLLLEEEVFVADAPPLLKILYVEIYKYLYIGTSLTCLIRKYLNIKK